MSHLSLLDQFWKDKYELDYGNDYNLIFNSIVFDVTIYPTWREKYLTKNRRFKDLKITMERIFDIYNKGKPKYYLLT